MNDSLPTSTRQDGNGENALATGVKLLETGFWVVAIHPGEKRPIGKGWGAERWSPYQLRQTIGRNPGAGIGICFGPGRGPSDAWIIDVEGDGPQAFASLARFAGAEPLETICWSSVRGTHWLFVVDGPRLLGALKAAGASERTDFPGVWHLPELPDLEFRVGGTKEDGTVKQVQSVVPPTVGTDGKPRAWIGSPQVGLASLRDESYSFLASLGYGKAALNGEIATLAIKSTGERHAGLLQMTMRLAGLVNAGKLTESAAHAALIEASRANGMLAEGRMAEVEEAWSSALEKATPRRPRGTFSRLPTSNGHPACQDSLLARFPLTDTGNAERMVARFGSVLRFCHAWDKWLVFNGKRWVLDDIASVHQLATKTARFILAEASTLDDADQVKAFVAWQRQSENLSRLNAMITLASMREGVPIQVEEMDSQGWLLNVQNGTIDLRTGTLASHRRDDLITQICPIEYDPAATCPLWDSTLQLFFDKDQPLIDYWQRLCGYCLVGTVRDHIMPIAYGTGANGKSTILGALLALFGTDYGMKCPPDLLMAKRSDSHPTDRADLFRKRIVVAIETESGRRLNETMIKEMTGGDRIRARHLFEDFWEFDPTHTLVMATNHKPVVRGGDHGVWRRLKLVPFDVCVEGPSADLDMPTKLKVEYPGILAWCVRGCLKWQATGLEEPPSVCNATMQYRDEQDRIGAFLDERTDAGEKVRARELYTAYKGWVENAGERPISEVLFAAEMGERGLKSMRNNGKWYLGITLRQDFH